MARKFTRIEFEGDVAVVVTALDEGFRVKGNQQSGWDEIIGFFAQSHRDVVNEVINRIDMAVHRRLTHELLG